MCVRGKGELKNVYKTHEPHDYKYHDERTTNAAFPSPFLCEMPLDVGPEVLNIVQRVCDRALNVATASAKSSTHGPKAGMRALYGKTVKHISGGKGIVKDRALKLALQKKKRKSGPSGASNWPRGSKETRRRFKEECARRAAERAAEAALRQAIDELGEEDDVDGPYPVRSPAEWIAILKVRQALAAEVGVSPNALNPSAAIAATLVPGTIDAYTTGYVVSMCDSDTNTRVRAGESMSVRKGSVMCEFVTPGVQRALVFHRAK